MRAVAAAALVACSGPDDPTDGPTRVDEQGVAVAVRTPEGGVPVTGEDELRVSLGGANPTVPDAAGFAFFFEATPDRLPVSADAQGHAGAFAAPEVRPEGLSGVSLVTLDLPAVADVPDAATPGRLDGDGYHVDVPGGALGIDDVPVAGPYVLQGHRVRSEADRAGAPQVQIAIRNDVDLVPIVVHELVVVRAYQEGERLRVVPDQKLAVTVEVDPGSPLLAPGATPVGWTLSSSVGYWAGVGELTVDEAAATISFEPGVVGWYALGLDNAERGCVTGRLVDPDGRGVDGVGIRSLEAGLLGVDGASALDGTFCVPVSPGAVAEVRGIGFAPDRSALYLWSDTVTGSAVAGCGDAACTDVGDVVMQAWRDADDDRYWDGPGGDCDDHDPEVNPTFAFGDASYCGGSL